MLKIKIRKNKKKKQEKNIKFLQMKNIMCWEGGGMKLY